MLLQQHLCPMKMQPKAMLLEHPLIQRQMAESLPILFVIFLVLTHESLFLM